jgi:hypothetical protein
LIGGKELLGKAVFRESFGALRRALCALAVCGSSIFCTINYAMAADENYVFFVDVDDIGDSKKFTFSMSAKGTFYIDCDGGTLKNSNRALYGA